MKRIVLAAPHSGSGKTTVASLLCLALRHWGLRVQPFKLGPDYLDPTHLGRAAGRAARNLDSFLLPPSRLSELFARAAAQADVSVLEGVMGLYDGRSPLSDEHSTADLARLLDAPVVLVIDAGGMARTVAAIASGLRDFGAGVHVAGVILNRVGSERHAELCEAALAQVGLPVLGFVTRDEALHLPSRHLGLLSAEQASWDEGAALNAARHLRLDDILSAAQAPPLPAAQVQAPAQPVARIGYALDEAFHFYYPDALDELREAGAELVPFSPLRDPELPAGIGGLLLGGGYPEAHAAQLSANVSMRQSVRAFAASGRPVVGECGGLMYLAESLQDLEGQTHEQCGVIPYRTRMQGRLTLGYRDATALHDTPLAPGGSTLRGHEFHYSALMHEPTRPAYRWTAHDGSEVLEGYAHGNVLASYLHLHYAADPATARRLVMACLPEARP
ncbi:cobyrinic acid a,c-diamide synthase [Deinococcus malanensis]|uniref:Cobyrinate a,c-diamide synthase n=1 Tax=Deinococcus malanensis TaxID=1706855 RepID=A0ABQ2ENB0_9DEIO|nr:cobyrinate a,c-diamide synthase [Deinococcus malanensis]GGK17934.1 cobyrinic acid a,c-diamide synthase [Deinococcus malanensis]